MLHASEANGSDRHASPYQCLHRRHQNEGLSPRTDYYFLSTNRLIQRVDGKKLHMTERRCKRARLTQHVRDQSFPLLTVLHIPPKSILIPKSSHFLVGRVSFGSLWALLRTCRQWSSQNIVEMSPSLARCSEEWI